MKRLAAFFLAVLFFFNSCVTAFACDENQTNTYVTQILFGDNAFSHSSDEKLIMLMDALYLCSEQADGSGQEKLDYLKSRKVSGLPELSGLNIQKEYLPECAHNTWEHELPVIKKKQKNRRKLLYNTVNKVFDFGIFDHIYVNENGKCNSMSALLYYSHILCDYLADEPSETEAIVSGKSVPSYSGQAYISLKGNKPAFTEREKKSSESGNKYSPLDSQGRAGAVFAKVGPDTVSSVDERKSTSNIEPTGWNNDNKYEGIVSSNPPAVYNKCHLLAHQLGGTEAKENIITGTSYLNNTGMKIFEERVAQYVKKTGNHVLYRATPVFKGKNKLASGVQLEAYSVEDAGEGVSFNVYCYNVQPGIKLNYANGENSISDIMTGDKRTLPFAVQKVSDSNPDLIFEVNKHLEILFKDQKNTNKYKNMMDNISTIATEARAVGSSGNKSQAQCYQELKKKQFDYFNVLKSYVPLLLAEEKFFKSSFK